MHGRQRLHQRFRPHAVRQVAGRQQHETPIAAPRPGAQEAVPAAFRGLVRAAVQDNTLTAVAVADHHRIMPQRPLRQRQILQDQHRVAGLHFLNQSRGGVHRVGKQAAGPARRHQLDTEGALAFRQPHLVDQRRLVAGQPVPLQHHAEGGGAALVGFLGNKGHVQPLLWARVGPFRWRHRLASGKQ